MYFDVFLSLVHGEGHFCNLLDLNLDRLSLDVQGWDEDVYGARRIPHSKIQAMVPSLYNVICPYSLLEYGPIVWGPYRVLEPCRPYILHEVFDALMIKLEGMLVKMLRRNEREGHHHPENIVV